MKNFLYKTLSAAAVLLLLFTGCKKDEAVIYYQGGTAPALTSSVASGSTIPLSPADSLNTAVSFSWTNPNYQFSDGISSLNVTYYLQVDTAGANFSSLHMQTIALTSSLDTAFSVTQFNSMIGNGLLQGVFHTQNIQIRLVSFLVPLNSPTLSNSTTLYSNVFNYNVTPFAPPPKVDTPFTSQLFLVGGDAALGAWSNPVPTSQQFTRVSGTDYQLTFTLSGGDPTNGDDQYLLLPQNGSWNNKYSCSSTSSQPFSGGGFGYNLPDNFPGPVSGGKYLIDVNFQTGTITITPK